MIDEQSSASGHDYASDHSIIGAGKRLHGVFYVHATIESFAHHHGFDKPVVGIIGICQH